MHYAKATGTLFVLSRFFLTIHGTDALDNDRPGKPRGIQATSNKNP
jgi:hypothetical protein